MDDFAAIFGRIIPILPPSWPDRSLDRMPGDLSQYIPQGFGLGGPTVLMPWDSLESMFDRRGFYGFDRSDTDPVRAAPATSAAGGVVYFDEDVEQNQLRSTLGLMGVELDYSDFAAFSSSSSGPKEDQYLDRLRLIRVDAIHAIFGVPTNISVPHGSVAIGDVVWRFIEVQRNRWTGDGADSLAGSFGGDGDWAKERLGFGFMVENSYWGIYQVWSRPWLVTK